MRNLAIAGVSALCTDLVALLVILDIDTVASFGLHQYTTAQLEREHTYRKQAGIDALQCIIEQCSPCQIIPTASPSALPQNLRRRETQLVVPDFLTTSTPGDSTTPQVSKLHFDISAFGLFGKAEPLIQSSVQKLIKLHDVTGPLKLNRVDYKHMSLWLQQTSTSAYQ